MKKVLVAVLSVLIIGTFSGCRTTLYALNSYREDIELARRLANGVTVVLEPDVDDLSTVTRDQLDTAIDILNRRLSNMECYDIQLSVENGNKIKMVIPENNGTQPGPGELIDMLSRRAVLEFRYIYSLPDENDDQRFAVAMEGTGEYIADARTQFGLTESRGNYEYYISVQFTNAGREAFKIATENAISGVYNGESILPRLAIVIDDEVVSTPFVNMVIDSTDCIINGGFDDKSARELEDMINSGRMPFGFRNVEIFEAE